METFDWTRLDLSLAGLRGHYRAGDFTPAELFEHLTDRCGQYAGHNIWITRLSRDQVERYLAPLAKQDPASLPLYGVPFAIKDNIDLAGIETTAGCRAFAYTPDASASVVSLLIAAGAVPLGKTNMDQFATGLVGTRSPFGECHNALNPDYISGGSSSGSAVATALGLVSFALGTDTAGSGRVPAAFNNLVGIKPSRGLLSCHGVVPACRSLDCVSLFTLNCDDAAELLALTEGVDSLDPFSRVNPWANSKGYYGPVTSFRFGIPRDCQRDFLADNSAQALFEQAIARLTELGGEPVELDFQPFMDAGRLLYEGPWVAERLLATQQILEEMPEQVLPVIRRIIAPAAQATAADAFAALYRLQALRQQADHLLSQVDTMLVPTTPTCFSRQAVRRDPIVRNSELGWYTNFINLLDCAALALPAGFLPSGVGWGITLFAGTFSDRRLLSIGARYLSELPFCPGADLPGSLVSNPQGVSPVDFVDLVVCGAHLCGMPLNWQLTERDARLVDKALSADSYRLYVLADGRRPALIKDKVRGGVIELEIWRMPAANFGSFVDQIPAPLGIGKVELADGRELTGFIAEPRALEGAVEITPFGGWRKYLHSL